MSTRKFKANRGDGVFAAFIVFIWGIGILVSLTVPAVVIWAVIRLVEHFTS